MGGTSCSGGPIESGRSDGARPSIERDGGSASSVRGAGRVGMLVQGSHEETELDESDDPVRSSRNDDRRAPAGVLMGGSELARPVRVGSASCVGRAKSVVRSLATKVARPTESAGEGSRVARRALTPAGCPEGTNRSVRSVRWGGDMSSDGGVGAAIALPSTARTADRAESRRDERAENGRIQTELLRRSVYDAVIPVQLARAAAAGDTVRQLRRAVPRRNRLDDRLPE